MKRYLTDRTVHLQCRPGADPSEITVVIGRVLEENANYLTIKGRPFRLRRTESARQAAVRAGDPATLILPWDRVELITLVDDKADCRAEIRSGDHGSLVLNDKPRTVIDPGSTIPAECYHG